MKPSNLVVNDSKRREFLRQLGIGSLGMLGLPSLVKARENVKHDLLPAGGDDEAYWESVKKQFDVDPALLMLNAANLCPAPKFLNEKVQGFAKRLASDVSFQYRASFAERRTKSIAGLAQFLGVTTDEIGITRNTSESNCILVNGLAFKAGDEIVVWDENHPSNKEAWETRAKRDGLIVTRVSLQKKFSKDDAIQAFTTAMSARTKMIALSHISNLSGIALPAKEICANAKSKGILTLIDGAQTFGFHEKTVENLGCDFYTASTHKWLMGPLENGILYVSKNHIEKLWPNTVGGGWHEGAQTLDQKVCILGQRNDTTTASLPDILEFHQSVGRKKIEDRVKFLVTRLKTQITDRVPQATFVTPIESDLTGGIVVINIPGKDPKDLTQRMYDKHGIATAATIGLRLSPHVYNLPSDIDRAVDALKSLVS